MSRRRSNTDWSQLTQKIQSDEQSKSYDDEGAVYKPQMNDKGVGNKIIRFLEPPETEEFPFAKVFNHGFQGTNGWFIENCPTTKGNDCPVCKENSRIWDQDEATARPRSRKLSYWSNVLVIQDKENPANEGKVFKYRYGVKIWDKIKEELADGNTVFSYENGSNFKLKMKKIQSGSRSYPSYDASSFSDPSPISLNDAPLTDDEIDDIHDQLQSLNEIVDDSKFKSYADLADWFTKKTGVPVATSPNGTVASAQPSAPVAVATSVAETTTTEVVETENVEDDEDAFFDALKDG